MTAVQRSRARYLPVAATFALVTLVAPTHASAFPGQEVTLTGSCALIPTQMAGEAALSFECQITALPDARVTFIRTCELYQGSRLLATAPNSTIDGPVAKTAGLAETDLTAGGSLRVCLTGGASFLRGGRLVEDKGCVRPTAAFEGVGVGEAQ